MLTKSDISTKYSILKGDAAFLARLESEGRYFADRRANYYWKVEIEEEARARGWAPKGEKRKREAEGGQPTIDGFINSAKKKKVGESSEAEAGGDGEGKINKKKLMKKKGKAVKKKE